MYEVIWPKAGHPTSAPHKRGDLCWHPGDIVPFEKLTDIPKDIYNPTGVKHAGKHFAQEALKDAHFLIREVEFSCPRNDKRTRQRILVSEEAVEKELERQRRDNAARLAAGHYLPVELKGAPLAVLPILPDGVEIPEHEPPPADGGKRARGTVPRFAKKGGGKAAKNGTPPLGEHVTMEEGEGFDE